MDVVSLPEKDDLKNNSDPEHICAVADDIVRLVKGRSGHFSIYVVFKKDLDLEEPFKLLHYTRHKSVTHVEGSFARKHGYPMWTAVDKQTAPAPNKYKDEYIKLDFFQNSESGGGIVYTWTDVYERADGSDPVPVMARVMELPKNKDMCLYLILPVKEASVLVLSEKAFGSYLTLKAQNREILANPMYCRIIGDCMTAKILLNCGHSYCELCWSKVEKQDKCCVCSKEISGSIRLKLRHGPCPIDMCAAKNNIQGAVLVPCGCHIYCHQLEKAYQKHKGYLVPLLKVIQYCPYDACKKKVETFKLPYL